ncbi:3583_t:CDS:1, partial [Paraglomus occultum]
IEAIQEALIALTKLITSLSKEFRQFRDVSLVKQTAEQEWHQEIKNLITCRDFTSLMRR